MSEEDFDLQSLATYLHLTPAKVTRLVDRGQLPGRRVGGEWRFSRQEIHHWLEERIGVADDEGLVRVEGILETAALDQAPLPVLSDLLRPETIAHPFDARTKQSVVTRIVQLGGELGLLWDPEKMASAVRAREEMHPTALDNGVALLHPRRPMPNILGEPFLALGITPQGIPFGAPRGGLTDIFFLICSVDESEHLRTLARLSRLVGDADWVAGLRQTAGPAEALAWVARGEADLTG